MTPQVVRGGLMWIAGSLAQADEDKEAKKATIFLGGPGIGARDGWFTHVYNVFIMGHPTKNG